MNGYECSCTGTSYSGTFCEIITTAAGCPLGQILTENSTCQQCEAGTIQIDNFCSPCQRGTFSNTTGASSLTDCAPCPESKYADMIGSTACQPCPDPASCFFAGSMMSNPPALPSSSPFTQATVDSKGNVISINSALVPGLDYLFAWIAFAVASCVLFFPFPILQSFSRKLAPLSVILRAPLHLLRLKGDRLKEIPSRFRGLIGLWVVVGLFLVTSYQIQNFVVLGRTDLSSIQPGTTFTDDS